MVNPTQANEFSWPPAPVGLPERVLATTSAQPYGWSAKSWDTFWFIIFPFSILVGVLAIHALNYSFYRKWILPEGYGFLEVGQFVLVMAAMVVCLWLCTRPLPKDWGFLRAFLLIGAVACLYIGGEEMSWGQHWFGWDTPEAWGAINRQDETNLHNTAYVFNQLPQVILEISIVISGIILPLMNRFLGGFKHWFLQLITPPLMILGLPLIIFGLKGLSTLQKQKIGTDILLRPSETMELFEYMFILFYIVILARRIMLLERQQSAAVAA